MTDIGDNAFENCLNLTSLSIPNSVKNIGKQVFKDCSSLTSIIIPNSVTNIEPGIFMNCNNLESIIVDNYNPNYDSRNNCNAIIQKGSNTLVAGCKNTAIPNSVTCIGERAFWKCSGLTTIEIPNSVTKIDDSAFYWCTNLSSMTIPNNLKTISDYSFYGCSRLSSIVIPNSVTFIGEWAFGNCNNMNSLTIGESVKTIGNHAFYGTEFSKISSYIDNPFKIDSSYNVFSLNTLLNAILYVPKGTVDKYKSTEGWKNFVNIEEGNYSGVDKVKANSTYIQGNDGVLTIIGADEGTPINVFDTTGKIVGSSTATFEPCNISTSLRSGEIGFVKIGKKTIKIIMY